MNVGCVSDVNVLCFGGCSFVWCIDVLCMWVL